MTKNRFSDKNAALLWQHTYVKRSKKWIKNRSWLSETNSWDNRSDHLKTKFWKRRFYGVLPLRFKDCPSHAQNLSKLPKVILLFYPGAKPKNFVLNSFHGPRGALNERKSPRYAKEGFEICPVTLLPVPLPYTPILNLPQVSYLVSGLTLLIFLASTIM